LRQRFGTGGSTLFSLTWKVLLTPSLHRVCALRGSGRRISDSGCTSWPSPRTTDTNGAGLHGDGGLDLWTSAQLASWPTPNVMEGGQTSRSGARKGELLMGGLVQAAWPTPRSEDSEQTGAHRGTADTLTSAGRLAGWPTPTKQDNDQVAGEYATNGTTLGGASRLASWATPTQRDHKDGAECLNVPENGLLGRQVWASGPPATGSPAGTGSGGRPDPGSRPSSGRLNPALPRWLQGLPEAWDVAAIRAYRAMKLTRTRRGKRG